MWIHIETTAGVSTYECYDPYDGFYGHPAYPEHWTSRNISPQYMVASRVRVDVLECAPMPSNKPLTTY